MCITITGVSIVDNENNIIYTRKYNKRITNLDQYRKRLRLIAMERYEKMVNIYFRYNNK